MKKVVTSLLTALYLSLSSLAVLAGGFSGDGFGTPGFFQFSGISASTGMFTPMVTQMLGPTSGTTTFWTPLVGSTTIGVTNSSSTLRRIPIPIAGTLSGLFFNLPAANAGVTIVDYLNTGSPAGTVTCTTGTNNCNSGALTQHLAAGTLLQWEMISNGNTWAQTNANPIQISSLFQADSGQNGFMVVGPAGVSVPGTTASLYSGFQVAYANGIATNEALTSTIMPTAGQILGLYVIPNATANTVPQRIAICQNGTTACQAGTTMQCSLTASTSTGCCVNLTGAGNIGGGPSCTTTTSMTVAAGDTLSVLISCPTANCASLAPGISVIWAPTTAGRGDLRLSKQQLSCCWGSLKARTTSTALRPALCGASPHKWPAP